MLARLIDRRPHAVVGTPGHLATTSRVPGDHQLQIADLHPEPNARGLPVGHFVGEVRQEAGRDAERGLPHVDLARLEKGQVERLASYRDPGVREIPVPEHLAFKKADRVTHRIGAPEEDDIERRDRHVGQRWHAGRMHEGRHIFNLVRPRAALPALPPPAGAPRSCGPHGMLSVWMARPMMIWQHDDQDIDAWWDMDAAATRRPCDACG
jgi:hypothetical protein